jgi:hypothetical protein
MRAVVLAALLAIGAYGEETVREKETIRKVFTMPSAGRLEVDNVWGSIEVKAYNGNEIRIVADKTLKADDAASAEEAKREVKLDLSQAGNVVKAYVDGPFRCNCGDGQRGSRQHRREGYTVEYDFHIEAPADTTVSLSTVNGGHVTVQGIAGDFDVENVNGGIEMTGIAGAGRVHTINGQVRVTFTRNPAGASSFQTLNGDVDVTLQPNASADVRVKTFHGDVYTDFDVKSLPRLAPSAERKDGHFVYRSDDAARFRIGNGGPEFKFETFNGNIRIRSRSQEKI